MLADYTQTQYDHEYLAFEHAPDAALANIRVALSLMPLLNTSHDRARLQAVKDIQAARSRAS